LCVVKIEVFPYCTEAIYVLAEMGICMKNNKKKVTMKDVAKYAGVAIGTVDRAINNTGYVSEKKKEVILRAINELNYVPNRAASVLSKQKQLTIGVVYPNSERYFWAEINKGIQKAEKQYAQYGLSVVRGYFENYNLEEQIRVLEMLIEKNKVDGLAFVPLHPLKFNPLINNLHQRGIPVVTFDSDAPASKRICFIGEDSLKGGKLAGRLMALFLGGKGKIAILRGQANLLAIQQRISGFMEKIAGEYPNLEIEKFYDMYEDERDFEETIYNIVEDISKSRHKIDGIFVTNALINIVGKAVKQTKELSGIILIGFDYSEEISELIQNDIVSAVVSTDLENEGYLAIKKLYKHINNQKTTPESCTISNFEIKIKETL